MTLKRFPQLAHWGAFTAVVEGQRLIACEPFAQDPDPSPIIDSIVAGVYSERRIRRPSIRRGWLAKREGADRSQRGSDDFVEVDWDTALDLVAGEIARVRGEHGAAGLFGGSYGWSSAGRLHHARSLIRRFFFNGGGCVDQVGNYSWGSAQFLLPHIIGTYSPLTGRVTSWPSIIEHAEVFIAFGGLALKNGQVSSGGAGAHTLRGWLQRLAQSKARVINISPTRDDCPDFVNAEWIPIRPNTDVALMLALAHQLFSGQQADREFLARYCVGADELEAYVMGTADGEAKTPAWAEGITGIPRQRIVELARQLAGKRSFMTCSFAVQRAQNGEQPYWMVIALSAILGQIGLPGGGFGFGHGSMNGVGNPRIATPGPEFPVGRNPAGLSIPAARMADMLLHPGTPYRFQGRDEVYPDTRLVHWAGGNPFHHHQQLGRLREAFTKPETIIVQDIWWTPTAQHADIVLPVTTSLERNDIGGSSRDQFILAMHQAIAPLHSARSDLDIFSDLAERLGYRATFTEDRDEDAWIRYIYANCAAAQSKAGVALPDFETFWRDGHVKLPPPEQDFVMFDTFRADPDTHPLQTPSGRIELASDVLRATGADLSAHPRWIAPLEWLDAPLAREFPLHLVSVQPGDRLHSQMEMGPLAQANKVAGVERITLHPDEAARRGLHVGEQVEVFNERGRIIAGLAVSDGVMPGVAAMAVGAWYRPDASGRDLAGNANVLTRDIGTSGLTQGPNAMSCLVEIRHVADTRLSDTHPVSKEAACNA